MPVSLKKELWPDDVPRKPWTCPKCGATILTREAGPRCPQCGFKEGT
jgi:rubrerythrin